MEKMLLLSVHFLDDRYHGDGEWPPSPARVFQALLAGNAVGAALPDACVNALAWLESLPEAPKICAQRGRLGLPYTTFVPNNDLDAKGGDPSQVANIRVGKLIRPRHIDARNPIVYGWRFSASAQNDQAAGVVCEMADNLYQLGRGVDMAWARCELLSEPDGAVKLEQAGGEIFRPGSGAGDGEVALDCPQSGSLTSLVSRFQAQRQRFQSVRQGRKTQIYFANPPKPRFRRVSYNPAQSWRLFDLRQTDKLSSFRSWQRESVVRLTEVVRDGLAARLSEALSEQVPAIEAQVIGRGATEKDKARRIRLIPIPSTGHPHVNPAVRRILLMVPPDCSLLLGDLEWALSGLRIADTTGAGAETSLVLADDLGMLKHYAVDGVGDETASRLWQSVTPLALPLSAARRRIDPAKLREESRARREHQAGNEAKNAAERHHEEAAAVQAVRAALRHADIRERPVSIRVRREPFDARGVRAELFAQGQRFAKERLWHVALRFTRPVAGPMVLGDGRYLGLGVMERKRERLGVFTFRIESGLGNAARPERLARSLRRAVMALVQRRLGLKTPLPGFFTGHEQEGSPMRSGEHRHLSFVADLPCSRLLVVAPHILERRRAFNSERVHLKLLDDVLLDLTELRAGQDGRLALAPQAVDAESDGLLGSARQWESLTQYRPTRHAKKLPAEQALIQDVLFELDRQNLPRPELDVLTVEQGPRGGLAGRVRLRFGQPQAGPIMIGRNRHVGGGVFHRMSSPVE
ncbi:MAG: type I-U CRISPR-associated protein Cas5/Cas6 [Gammaproteobacteria bacterium]|nr:type I-U CRISPR-associated protein Cas5/Cas6 [Gammaproteobacteria bacterium]